MEPAKRTCVIVDIDGTIADGTHRQHYLDKSPRDWESFLGAMGGDDPITPVIAIVRAIRFFNLDIVLCSGRMETYRELTTEWLGRHEVPFHELYMRSKDDFRDDVEVKSELLDQILADGFNPLAVIDDRNKVVKMWRSRGLVCLQCAEGDF